MAKMHPAQRALETNDLVWGIDPFWLFAMYHLGLKRDQTAAFMNVYDVARALEVSPEAVQDALSAYAMTPGDMVHSGFDVASAQVDIQVSPPGVDLLGLAEMHFEAFIAAADKPRDWSGELAADAEAVAETFGAPDARHD